MEFWVFLIYTGYKIFLKSDMCFLIFFWCVAHAFMFLTGLFKKQILIFGEDQSATFSCVACALCALLKKLLPNLRSERFSSRNFMVPSFTFKEWVIVQGVSEWLNFYFGKWVSNYHGATLPESPPSFHWTEEFSYFHGKSMGCTDVTLFCPVDPWVCPLTNSMSWLFNFMVNLEIRQQNSSNYVLFQNCFGYFSFFAFPHKL